MKKTTQGFLMGTILLILGFYFLHLEMQKTEPHSGHVYTFAVGIALGVLLMGPAIVISSVAGLITAITPLLDRLPMIKFTRRKDDITPEKKNDNEGKGYGNRAGDG